MKKRRTDIFDEVVVIEGSEGDPYESPTDGCYLCMFGDEDGTTDCNFCKDCKLKEWEYYGTINQSDRPAFSRPSI